MLISLVFYVPINGNLDLQAKQPSSIESGKSVLIVELQWSLCTLIRKNHLLLTLKSEMEGVLIMTIDKIILQDVDEVEALLKEYLVEIIKKLNIILKEKVETGEI